MIQGRDDAAKIMALNGCEVIDNASHDALMAARGFHCALWQMSQSKGKGLAGAQATGTDLVTARTA
jgi:hypothetical protein